MAGRGLAHLGLPLLSCLLPLFPASRDTGMYEGLELKREGGSPLATLPWHHIHPRCWHFRCLYAGLRAEGVEYAAKAPINPRIRQGKVWHRLWGDSHSGTGDWTDPICCIWGMNVGYGIPLLWYNIAFICVWSVLVCSGMSFLYVSYLSIATLINSGLTHDQEWLAEVSRILLKTQIWCVLP